MKAKCLENGEKVAIKKVLQDKKFKNRELQIMQYFDHPNVVQLKNHFFVRKGENQLYLNLVMEYVPQSLYSLIKNYGSKTPQIFMPLIYVKLYIYQVTSNCVSHLNVTTTSSIYNYTHILHFGWIDM